MDIYKQRRLLVIGLMVLVAGIYLAKLVHLQVFSTTYKAQATQNVIRKITVYPSRGLIYDRNKNLIVVNDAVYDLMVVPNQVKSMDTIEFCRLLEIDSETFNRQLKKARKYSRHKPSVLLTQIPVDVYGRFHEYLHLFPGFYGQARTLRSYPYRSAAHTVGYIGEVDSQTIRKSGKYYQPGDYVGISGLEQIYEKYLRGKRGVRYALVDVLNRVKGSFQEGRYDTSALAGKNLVSTLDIDLQVYGEKLMRNKKGSVIAIEPSTGEILAIVSSPSYDPNLFSGRRRGQNFRKMARDTLDPLFNRPIMAQYSPGSTFKPVVALIGMQERTLRMSDGFPCNGTYTHTGFTGGCHAHRRITDAAQAIQYSCNAYFWNAFRELLELKHQNGIQGSYSNFRDHALSFGLGHVLDIDVPNENSGFLPEATYYDKLYEGYQWKAATIISLGIGQGELSMTPLQMANLMAIFANRGYYYTPHLLKEVLEDTVATQKISPEKVSTSIDHHFYEPVVDGLEQVILHGTAVVAKIEGVEVCGKTGTVENPHGEDHSTFVAFAPKHQPKIAISVIVENGGWGSSYAAPIASLMIEKYMNDTISHSKTWLEERMLETNLINPDEE